MASRADAIKQSSHWITNYKDNSTVNVRVSMVVTMNCM